jgi:hypothetical protein
LSSPGRCIRSHSDELCASGDIPEIDALPLSSRRLRLGLSVIGTDEMKSQMAREITGQSKTIPAVSLLALALGAAGFGAVAIGALAIGRLAVGRLVIKKARFSKLEVDELTVRRLRVVEHEGPKS